MKAAKYLRYYLCILVFLLPLLFGSYAGGTEQPNFPVSILEWLICGMTPSFPAFLAPILSGIALMVAVAVHPAPPRTTRSCLCLTWSIPLLAGLMGLVRTTEYDYAFNWLFHFAGGVALAVAVYWTAVQDKELMPALLNSIVASALLLVLTGWYQRLIGLDDKLRMFRDNAAKTGIPLDGKLEQKLLQKRVYSFFIDPNLFGAHLVLTLPISCWRLYGWGGHFKPESTSRRVLVGLGLLLFLVALYWTGSRGAAIGLVIGLAVAIWCEPFIQRWKWKWVLPVLAVVGVVAIVCFAALSREREGMKSASARVGYYSVAWRMFTESPVTGKGLGEFFPYYMKYKPVHAEETRDPHNFVLGMLCQNGILGGIAALIALGMPFFLAIFHGGGDRRRSMLLFGLCGWSVHTLFEFNELIPGTFYLVAVLLGVILLDNDEAPVRRIANWVRIPAAVFGLLCLVPVLRIPGEHGFQQLERGEFAGNVFGRLDELSESLPRSVGPLVMKFNVCYESLVPRLGREVRQSVPRDLAERHGLSAIRQLTRLVPHRSSNWRKAAEVFAVTGEWSEAEQAIEQALEWYPGNGNNYLVKVGIIKRRADWMPVAKTCDAYLREHEDGYRLDMVFDEELKPLAKDLCDAANEAELVYQDGKPIRFSIP